MNFPNARLSELTMETDIAASPQDVWTALTENIGQWWPADFYAGGEDGSRNFHLEAKPGGRMYEEWADGGGVLWATVYTVEPGKRLQVSGLSFANWGGPSQWLGSWDLSEHNGGTRLRFSEHAIGRVSDDYGADKLKGWEFLWDALKASVEGKAAPEWRD